MSKFRRRLLIAASGGSGQRTLILVPSSYDTENYQWDSASNIDYGYQGSTGSDFASFGTGGYGKSCYIYYKFDTSQIPEGATIDEVSCSVRVYVTLSTYTNKKEAQLFTGLTAKGTATTFGSSSIAFDLDCGEWTLEEIRDIRVRAYASAKTSTQKPYMRFYGATLTIKYTVE